MTTTPRTTAATRETSLVENTVRSKVAEATPGSAALGGVPGRQISEIDGQVPMTGGVEKKKAEAPKHAGKETETGTGTGTEATIPVVRSGVMGSDLSAMGTETMGYKTRTEMAAHIAQRKNMVRPQSSDQQITPMERSRRLILGGAWSREVVHCHHKTTLSRSAPERSQRNQ